MFARTRLLVLLLTAALIIPMQTVVPFVSAQEREEYWPTESWRTSTPEEQGMDSAALAAFIEHVPELGDVDSLMIVRNGYVVAEAYWHPFSSGLKHELFSASESIISALVGIAIDQGYIQSADQKIMEFFPEIEVEDLDFRKQAIAIDDLLTMRSGFDCEPSNSLFTNIDPIADLVIEPNATRFGLDRQMAGFPGTVFRYCQINAYLLSAILTQTTGMSPLAFAQQHLFGPLGIADAEWMVSKEGLDLGYAGLWLTTADMAKIGYLYLNQGQWDGEQIVPTDWVADSVRQLARAHEWPYLGYGFLWWVWDAPFGHFYEASGLRFQRIMVSEEENLVMVVTAADDRLSSKNLWVPYVMEAVVNAVRADEPLPPDPEGTARLEAATIAAASPQAQPLPSVPLLASEISGKKYWLSLNNNLLFPEIDRMRVPDNDWLVTTLAIDFTGETAALTLQTKSGTELQVPVGLDNVYRVTDSPFGTLAAKGAWVTETTFVLYLRFLEPGRLLKYTLTFSKPQPAGLVELANPYFGEDFFNGGLHWIWGSG